MTALALMGAACGPTGSKPDAAVTEPEKERTSIEVGPAKVWLPGSWTMDADKSQVTFTGDDKTTAEVKSVAGALLKGDSVESRFTAKGGTADTASGKIVLVGDVRVTSERDDIVLYATKVTYDKETALIMAEGSVRIVSKTWESGPFPLLVATPGLEKVGTPDRFRK